MWKLFLSIKDAIYSMKLKLIEFFCSLMHLMVLFSFIDWANMAPDVYLRLFFRKFRKLKFTFPAIERPKSSPPLSLIRLFERSTFSTHEFSSKACAIAFAV